MIGVGGVPWKIRAAAKAGRKLVLIPAENAKEVAQVPNDVLAKLEVVPVKTIQEALERVLLEALTVEAEDRARAVASTPPEPP